MALYAGVNGAVKKLYPYCGRANAVKRIIRSKCGVNNAVRECQCYLDEIDHVEIEFYDLQVYTAHSTDGGTKVCEGRSACAARGASISFSGKTITLNISGQPAEYMVYTHFRYWMVLKDGYKLRLDYAKTADAKTITTTFAWKAVTYNSRSYYYPYIWGLGSTDSIMTLTGSRNVTLSSGYSGGCSSAQVYEEWLLPMFTVMVGLPTDGMA